MDLVDQYEKSLQNAGSIVEGVNEKQLDDPTPCSDWDVRTLLNHMIGANFMFAKTAAGEEMDFSQSPPDFTTDDFKTTYQHSAKAAVEAFRAPGTMERTMTLPIGEVPGELAVGVALLEAVTHGWDLARATKQDSRIDDDLATMMLAAVQASFDPKFREGPNRIFGPEVKVGEDATPGDKLMAFLGRKP